MVTEWSINGTYLDNEDMITLTKAEKRMGYIKRKTSSTL